MSDHLLLLAPSANRVYAGDSPRLSAAELEIMLLPHGRPSVASESLAGVDYLRIATEELSDAALRQVGRLSSRLALFRRTGEALHPVPLPDSELFDDDLLSIPKYPGKTNEQFTRLLLNVTAAAAERRLDEQSIVLDPLCGRGTTLSAAVTHGWNAAGLDSDAAAVEAYATFLRTYLRRKRLKHSVESHPVRRDGRNLGRRITASLTSSTGVTREISIMTSDTRDSVALWGKRRFDLVVTDAPYGVVHGSQSTDRTRERSSADLLRSAVGGWAGQLKKGGALGLSWNTHALSREELSVIFEAAGLRVCDEEPFRRFAHRVDAGIQRDLLIGVRPLTASI